MFDPAIPYEPISPEKWLELVELHSDEELKQIIQGQHPADLANLLDQLTSDHQLHLFELLETDVIPEVLSQLDQHLQFRILSHQSDENIAEIIDEMDSDDAADVLGAFDDERTQAVLNNLEDDSRIELTELLEYDVESAGGIMAKEAAAAPENATVSEVIEILRELGTDIDDIYNVYLFDENEKLTGTISLKTLILAKPGVKVKTLMNTDIVSVNVNMDQEEVASLISRYDLASLPVVDNDGKFLGRITHDDILDVLADEAHEDFARLTGQSEFDPGDRSLFRNLRNRLPWLILGLCGGLGAATLLSYFEPQLAHLTTLIFFLPLVPAMGGNAGIQTSSLMVRGLATGEIVEYGTVLRIFREFAISLLAGIACAILIFAVVMIWQDDFPLALVVSLALLVVIVLAASIGVIIPLILKKFGLDPALATGPFITASNDILGLFIYLGIATMMLSLHS